MKTLKKLWDKIKIKTKSTKNKFVEIINARLAGDKETKSAKIRQAFSMLITAAITISFFYFFGKKVPLIAVYESVDFVLNLFFIWLPLIILVDSVSGKLVSFILAPEFFKDTTVVGELIDYPKFLWRQTKHVFLLLVNLLALPRELIVTKDTEGFRTNMTAWFKFWTPRHVLDDSLADVTVSEFHREETLNGHKRPAEQPKGRPTPKRPPVNRNAKLHPVTV